MARRSLSNPGIPQAGVPPARRVGGTRHETSERLKFIVADKLIDGWALNISRGGLRAIVDENIELGTEVEVSIGEATARPGRIVWIQDEPDGAIVGVEFTDVRDSLLDTDSEALPQSNPRGG
ncbi:MAG: PilZ domain-containing protein [Polyangiaceae bacterium]